MSCWLEVFDLLLVPGDAIDELDEVDDNDDVGFENDLASQFDKSHPVSGCRLVFDKQLLSMNAHPEQKRSAYYRPL